MWKYKICYIVESKVVGKIRIVVIDGFVFFWFVCIVIILRILWGV